MCLYVHNVSCFVMQAYHHVHVCVCVCACVCVHVGTCLRVCVYVCVFSHLRAYACWVRACACVCVCVWACVLVCAVCVRCVYACVCALFLNMFMLFVYRGSSRESYVYTCRSEDLNESPASSGGHTSEPFSSTTVRHDPSYHTYQYVSRSCVWVYIVSLAILLTHLQMSFHLSLFTSIYSQLHVYVYAYTMRIRVQLYLL